MLEAICPLLALPSPAMMGERKVNRAAAKQISRFVLMPEGLLVEFAVEADQPAKLGRQQQPDNNSAGQRHLLQLAEAKHVPILL